MIVVIKKTQPAKECESCERFIMGKCVIGASDKLPNNCPLTELARKQADVVERKSGDWFPLFPIVCDRPCRYECSSCGSTNISMTNYCPNCGADMRPEPPKEVEHGT